MIFQPILLTLTLAGPLHPVPVAHKTPHPVRQQKMVPLVQAQGHPMHVNYFVASSKRSDLRLNAMSKGTDVAFTEWLIEEKPHVVWQYGDTPAK